MSTWLSRSSMSMTSTRRAGVCATTVTALRLETNSTRRAADLMERTVRHLVMAGRPRPGDARHARVRVDMTGSGAVLQLGYRIQLAHGCSGHCVCGLRMSL